MKNFFIPLIIIIFIALFGIVCWPLERYLNYSISYRAMVQQTIKEMVKPEALKQ